MQSMLWTLANAVMLLAFLFSVVVQFNDPDPLRWAAIYTVAALACMLALLRRDRWWLPAATAAAALVWAAALAPGVIGRVPFRSMFREFEMADMGIEQSREMYGLLLIAGWMVVLAVAAWRRQRSDRNVPSIML